MTGRNLVTDAQNTWCPGCGNFVIQHTLKKVIEDREKEGKDPDDVVLVTGIGCHAKIADYLNVNSFYSLHGRTIPVASGLKLANPDLNVICCCGDGDCYAEGLDHLLFAAKRNIDITVIVHDNRVYGLTTGQYTPTSPLGFRGKSTPAGTAEYPVNPLDLALAAGATYIARGYTKKMAGLTGIIRGAVAHRGFSFVEVLQICATFFPAADFYEPRVYELSGHDPADRVAAEARIREWDYSGDGRIALGLLYEKSLPTFNERVAVSPLSAGERGQEIKKFLATMT